MAGLVLAVAIGGAAPADEPIDEIVVLPLPPATPYRVWVSDFALNHLVDGKVHIVDGKTGAYQGVVPMGFTGATTLSPDGSRFHVATTYYDRGTRGNKVDVLESYDAGTLEFLGEILLPPKRAMALTYEPLAAITQDGRFALIQNATPASSVTIVDLAGKRVAGEIDTAGCWAVHPSPTTAARFTTICGDGTFETIELTDAGAQA
jgi:methylamine dehydrogenase heavy chain